MIRGDIWYILSVIAGDKLQKYLYELSQFYGDDIDEEGNIEYVHFNDYFWDKTRKALLILQDKSVAGFVLINSYSYIGENPIMSLRNFVFCRNIVSHILLRKHLICCVKHIQGNGN